jgi:hypothetical protein
LIRAAVSDLFDQGTAFGRLALVHVAMMAGDTMVTVSLAGSLFFSVSPDEAKSKVLAYLLLTFAPFAVVSPILGPLIDRSANGRRVLVASSAGLRVVLCWWMAQRLNSPWLFPIAFVVLIAQKLYAVTRGTLVPEMARTDQLRHHVDGVGASGWPATKNDEPGYAGFNAQLTLLGAITGFVAGGVAAGVLKTVGASVVLVMASVIYLLATIASARLQRPNRARDSVRQLSQEERDLHALNPLGDREVVWGLSATAALRFASGFATFLLAFGLRRAHAGLGWFAAGLSASGLGAMAGLGIVTRVRNRLREHVLLTASLLFTGAGAWVASLGHGYAPQIGLAAWLGVWGSVGQPSFDAITQRHVAPGAQGRTFARFAVRQQLLWVVGAVVPVAITLRFPVGDRLLAVVVGVAGVVYGIGRRTRS